MSIILETLGHWLSETLDLDDQDLKNCLGPSRNPKEGDMTLASFPVAKRLKKSPPQITADWHEKLNKSDCSIPLTKNLQAAGPYLNFHLDGSQVAKHLLQKIIEQKDTWGQTQKHQGERVCLDFSHPNIAKPFAIHHMRSTLIGAAIGNLLESQGYTVERINHLGDWGTQFGYVMLAWNKYHQGNNLGEYPIQTLVELYQRVNNEAKESDEQTAKKIHQEAAHWFKRLEDGDEEARRLWKWFRDISITELEKIYDRLGIHFDTFRGEAYYEDKLDDAVNYVDNHQLLTLSDGAQVVDLGDDMPPLLLRKSDGATLYATRDVAAILDRWQRGEYTHNIYVVSSQQSLHFKQLFKLFELLNHPCAKHNVHVAFGMLRMPDGTLGKTRSGNVIYLDEVLDIAHQKARERIKNIDQNSDLEELAEQIGLGAVYFNDLKAQRIKDITFKWEDILSFEGKTGAYLQYAQARMNSILEKGNWDDSIKFDGSLLTHEKEKDLMLTLDRYGEVLSLACEKFEPNILLNYLFDLTQVYSSLTQDKQNGIKVLVDDDELKNARLALVNATRQTLVNGLKILCIPCPKRM